MTALSTNIVGFDGIWNNGGGEPHALYDAASNTLFWAAIRASGTVEITAFDYTRKMHSTGYPRGTTVLEIDDHDNPGICVLASGKVLVAYGLHIGDQYCATSSNARDIRTWNAEKHVSSNPNDSYFHLAQAGDTSKTIYWFFRRYTGVGTEYDRYFRISTDDGATWGSETEILHNAGQRPYLTVYPTSASRFDWVMTPVNPNEGVCSIYHGYMTIASDGTRAYYKTDGTLVGHDADLPFTPSQFTLVYDGTTTGSFMWDFNNIGGVPVICHVKFNADGTTQTYAQARWNGSAWQSQDVLVDGASLLASQNAYAGGMAQDPNNIDQVYLSKQYGSGDYRLELWAQTGTFPSGTWAKSADVSGSTGSINARPYTPKGMSPTRCLYWRGTYTAYTTFSTKVYLTPAPPWRAAKPTSPVWTSSWAPAGIQSYFLFNEGSGSTVHDLANARDGSVNGSPTWNAGGVNDFGPYMNGFTTSNFVALDTLAAAFNQTNLPVWMVLLFKTSSVGTSGEWAMSFSNNGSNNPLFGAVFNINPAASCEGFWRDTANAGLPAAISAGTPNDGEYHVAWAYKVGASDFEFYLDTLRAVNATTTGTVTFNRGTIGVLRRTTIASPFTGQVHAALVGWGSVPDWSALTLRLLQGQFDGTFNPSSSGLIPVRMTGGMAEMAGGLRGRTRRGRRRERVVIAERKVA